MFAFWIFWISLFGFLLSTPLIQARSCWPCVCRRSMLICRGRLVNHITIDSFWINRIVSVIIEDTFLYSIPTFRNYRMMSHLTLSRNTYLRCYMLRDISHIITIEHDMSCINSSMSTTSIAKTATTAATVITTATTINTTVIQDKTIEYIFNESVIGEMKLFDNMSTLNYNDNLQVLNKDHLNEITTQRFYIENQMSTTDLDVKQLNDNTLIFEKKEEMNNENISNIYLIENGNATLLTIDTYQDDVDMCTQEYDIFMILAMCIGVIFLIVIVVFIGIYVIRKKRQYETYTSLSEIGIKIIIYIFYID